MLYNLALNYVAYKIIYSRKPNTSKMDFVRSQETLFHKYDSSLLLHNIRAQIMSEKEYYVKLKKLEKTLDF